MKQLDRRSFMQRTSVAGLSLVALNSLFNRAVADPDPAPGTPSNEASGFSEPEIFAFQLGGTEAFVIHDGTFRFPAVQPFFAPEAKPAELEELLKKNFLPHGLALSLNVLVVKAKSGVMLFDAGAGSGFGPVAGKLVRGLARIGITPRDVKVVYVTHAHPDHIGGLVDSSNAPVFPSARIIAAKSEIDFWTAEAPDLSGVRAPAADTAQSLAGIKKMLAALKPNLDLKSPGKLSPEVELLAAPGHTPGHSLFQLTFGDEKLLVIGDAVHLFALQFPHPEWSMIFDVDPNQAISTRRRLFTQAAADRAAVFAFHLPFPGIGHVRKIAESYEWVPRPWVG